MPETPITTPKRILVVEDVVETAAVLTAVLELEGHTVATAHDGYEGLERVAQAIPDVIILDLRMPGMDGWEFLNCLRRLPAPVSGIRVILATAELKTGEELNLPVQGCLSKPVDFDKLLAMVA